MYYNLWIEFGTAVARLLKPEVELLACSTAELAVLHGSGTTWFQTLRYRAVPNSKSNEFNSINLVRHGSSTTFQTGLGESHRDMVFVICLVQAGPIRKWFPLLHVHDLVSFSLVVGKGTRMLLYNTDLSFNWFIIASREKSGFERLLERRLPFCLTVL